MSTEPTPIVRLALRYDAAAIHEVLLASFAPIRDLYTPAAFDATVMDDVRVAERAAEGPMWLATIAGRPVGTFGCRDDDRGHYLRGMGVVPDARGFGIGAALLQAALRHVDEAPTEQTWLYTTPFLHAAISLYEGAGFVRVIEDPAVDLFGTELIRMNLGDA